MPYRSATRPKQESQRGFPGLALDVVVFLLRQLHEGLSREVLGLRLIFARNDAPALAVIPPGFRRSIDALEHCLPRLAVLWISVKYFVQDLILFGAAGGTRTRTYLVLSEVPLRWATTTKVPTPGLEPGLSEV